MLQESSRVEFKVTLNDKLEKEIVAFLNNREGGMLYIGIDDEGCPIANPDIDSMQLKIADRIKDNILPSTQLGSGMSRILRFYDKSIFNISDHFIKVVFPFLMPKGNRNIASGDNNGDNNGDEVQVLLLLEKEPNITAKRISEQTGFSTRKISRIVKNLREAGQIRRIGSARKGYWKINKQKK